MNARAHFLRYRLSFAVAIILETFPTAPLPGQSLDSLVRHAAAISPSISAGRLNIEQELARARAEGAWEEPRIGLEFGELPTAEPLPWSQGETMIMGEQTIPLFGQNRAMRDAMEIGARVMTEDLLDREWELRGRVEREYYELWLVDRRIEVAKESNETAEYLYQSIESRFSLGRATQADLLLARGEVERLESELRELNVQRAALLARLNRLVGYPIDRPIIPVISDSDLDYSPLPSTEIAPDINPQLRRMTVMSEMSEAQAVAAERMLKPMLMLRGGVSFMPKGHPVREGDAAMSEETGNAGEGEEEVMRFGVTIGAMISIPIAPWSRSGPDDRAEAYRLQAASQLHERNAMELEMEMMLATAVADLDRATLRETYYRETGIPLLERTREALDLEYGEGRTTFNRLLDANSMLTMTRMEAFMARMERAMALSMIRRLVGIDILKGK